MIDNTDNAVFRGRIDTARRAEFQAWERRVGTQMAARQQIVPQRIAFELRDADVLERDPAYGMADAGVLVNARTGRRIALDGDPDLVARVLGAIASRSAYAEMLSAIPEEQREAAAGLCHHLLGSVIIAPSAVDQLERHVSLAQLVRFPQQSPYAVPRAYWENSIAVREALPLLYQSAGSSDAFAKAFGGLHRLATLGENGRNFYGAASGLPTEPGEFRQRPARTWVTRPVLQTVTRWLEHLGVREPLAAGGSPPATGDGPLTDLRDDGLTCVHLGGGESIRAALEDVRQQLLVALGARAQSARGALIASCARVHQLVVAVHPFTNVNNSMAMNVVNDLLSSGGAVPHLFLDYLALRMTPTGYATAFAAAVSACGSDVGDTALEHRGRRGFDQCAELLRLATLEHWPSFRATARAPAGEAG